MDSASTRPAGGQGASDAARPVSGNETSGGLSTGSSSGSSGGASAGSSTISPHQVLDNVQQTAGDLMDSVREQLTEQLNTQKEQLAGTVGSVAQALRQAGQQLEGQPVGSYFNGAAGNLEEISSFLRNRDLDDIAGEVEDFARSQTGLFLGGAFVLGFFAVRFLKSTRRQPQGQDYGQYSSQYSGRSYGAGQSSGMGYTGGYSRATGPAYRAGSSLPEPGFQRDYNRDYSRSSNAQGQTSQSTVDRGTLDRLTDRQPETVGGER